MNMTRLSIKRPVGISMIVAFFVVLGLYSYYRIGVELLPALNTPCQPCPSSKEATNPVPISGSVKTSGNSMCSASITAISRSCHPSEAVIAAIVQSPNARPAQTPTRPAAASIAG